MRDINELFSDVLPFIKDSDLRERLVLILSEYTPAYWYVEGASSTGKYHPEFASGDGGLMRHSKAAMAIGNELLLNPLFGDKFNDHQKDLLLISLLIHDLLKYNYPNKEEYTRFDHPILMANYVMDNYELWDISKEDAEYMAEVISSHMGPWTTSQYAKGVELPVPQSDAQIFVHLCDYLASRKLINIKFDEKSLILK